MCPRSSKSPASPLWEEAAREEREHAGEPEDDWLEEWGAAAKLPMDEAPQEIDWRFCLQVIFLYTEVYCGVSTLNLGFLGS